MDGRLLPLPAAGPPEPGVNSNFINPINHAPNLIACNVILLVVSTLIVGARVVSRTLLTDWRLGWDDCTCSFRDFTFFLAKFADALKDTIIIAFVRRESED